jgi:hypothetical protein
VLAKLGAVGCPFEVRRSAVAQYLVSMELPEAAGPTEPLPSIESAVGLMQSALLPSLQSLLALKAQGKVLTGGYRSGREQSLMLIMEAESEEEVLETLRSLPCWNDEADTDVARLHVIEELSGE